MDIIFQRLSEFVWYLIAALILVVIALMLARLILNKADLNPFSRPVILIRRWSDPLVNPVRRPLVQMGFSPNVAPLVTILIAILMGFFASRFLTTVLFTVRGLIVSVTRAAPIAFVGFLIYGALAILSLLIFMRIVVSWGASPTNRLLHLLIRLTEPVLAPFRRVIPPLGMFDISPIIVLLLLDLLQLAVAQSFDAGSRPRD
jgi:YggT family protein